MQNNDQSLTIFLYTLSFIYGGIGVLIGIAFMFSQLGIGILIAMMAVLGGIILFILGKVLQVITEMNITSTFLKNLSKEKQPIEEKKANVNENGVSDHEKPQLWELSSKERQAIKEFYRKNNQQVEDQDILVSPFPKYCVIKAEEFIDVIDMKEGAPEVLNREQVENVPELKEWIEENLFGNS